MSANSIMPAYSFVPLFLHGEVSRGGAHSLIRFASNFYTVKRPRRSISLLPQAAGASPNCLLSYHAMRGSVNSFLPGVRGAGLQKAGFSPCRETATASFLFRSSAPVPGFPPGTDAFSYYAAASSILSIKMPYPVVGSFTSTWVTAPMSLPSWTMGLPDIPWTMPPVFAKRLSSVT